MSTGSATATRPGSMPGWRVLGILLCETEMEGLRLLRSPGFAVPTLLFPLMFYLMFGVALGSRDPGIARYSLVMLSAFAIMAPGLFGVGLTLAMDRDRGLLELKRALPVPAGVYLGAKLIVAVMLACVVQLMMIMVATTLGRVGLSLTQCGALLLLAAAGVVPFCSLGLLVGTLARGQAAVAVLNLVYLPMSFLSGLWIPLSVLPHIFGQWAPVWPAYHLGQLALALAGGGGHGGGISVHVLYLLAMAAGCFWLAGRRLGGSR